MRVSTKNGIPAPDLRFLYLSPASRHALLGMRGLALAGVSGRGRFQLAREAARRGGLSAQSVSKIFQRLSRRGLLVARRGPGGGYALSRPSSTINLVEILRAVQDIIPGGHHCLLRNRLCQKGGYCLIHRLIIEADRLLIAGLASLTLKDLVESEGWPSEVI